METWANRNLMMTPPRYIAGRSGPLAIANQKIGNVSWAEFAWHFGNRYISHFARVELALAGAGFVVTGYPKP